ncbi:MAG: S8 family serine peptidase [Planctomycetia bacterium]|nr:S8 family serine peptidase [Planctomycetia bacterium]
MTGYVSGTLWFDTDFDGEHDSGEAGAGGILVNAYDGNSNLVGSTTTAADGTYQLALPAEVIDLQFAPVSGFNYANTATVDVLPAMTVPVSAGLTTTLPIVSVSATGDWSEEGPTGGSFVFSRTGSLSQSLTVSYSLSGTATLGVDYTGPSSTTGSFTFGSGQATHSVPISILDDEEVEGAESIRVDLLPSANYANGTPGGQDKKPKDNDGGLKDSKGAVGTNHTKAHTTATGTGVKIGVIEAVIMKEGKPHIGVDPTKAHLGNRLKANLDFSKIKLQANDQIGAGGGEVAANALRSDHATLVADVIGSSDATFTGVAKDADIYVASTLNNEQNFAAFDWLFRQENINLFNMPLSTLGLGNNTNGNNPDARFIDWFARVRNTLFVFSAGNTGINAPGWGDGFGEIGRPADAFNGITVGAVTNDFKTRAQHSSYRINAEKTNPNDPEFRGTPMIVAPGGDGGDNGMTNGNVEQSGTSFAAPAVTGIAAMLTQKAGADADAKHHLTLKATILNSARKRFITGENAANDKPADHATTANGPSDKNYLELNADGSVKGIQAPATAQATASWTPSKWTVVDSVFKTSSPLDDEQGTGLADAERALQQQAGGKVTLGTDATPVNTDKEKGWAFGSMQNNQSRAIKLNYNIKKGTFITATVTWDRVVNEADDDNKVETVGDPTYESLGMPNYNLELYKGDTLIARSESHGDAELGDNTEHLHFPVAADGNDYKIVVKMEGNDPEVQNPPFALAFWTKKD